MAAPIFLAAKAAASAVAKKAAQRVAVQQAAKTAVKATAALKGARGGADSERNEKDGKRGIAMLFVGMLAVVVVLAGSIVNGTIVGLASIVTPGQINGDVCVLFPEEGGDEPPVDLDPDHSHDEDAPDDSDTSEPTPEETDPETDPDPDDEESEVIFPLPADANWRLTSKFGPRNIGGGASRYHRGTDLAAPRGTLILAPVDGKVVAFGTEGARGKFIRIQHKFRGQTFDTLSQHMDRFVSSLRVGSPVKAGQVVGYVGNTGLSIDRGGGGYHLHFELWARTGVYASAIDPMPWLKSNGAKGIGDPLDPDPGMEDIYGGEWDLDMDMAEVCEMNQNTEGAGPWDDYENGRIPSEALESPKFNDKIRLAPDAAAALDKMNAAYKEEFGQDLKILAAYKSISDQKKCQEEKEDKLPKLCPAPGKDPFGMAKMIEVGKPGSDRASEEYAWLVKHASEYDWKQSTVTSTPGWWKYVG